MSVAAKIFKISKISIIMHIRACRWEFFDIYYTKIVYVSGFSGIFRHMEVLIRHADVYIFFKKNKICCKLIREVRVTRLELVPKSLSDHFRCLCSRFDF